MVKMSVNVPAVPKKMEAFGNFFTRTIGRFILKTMGWTFEGNFPDLEKFIIIVAPHTSNWDFFIGISAMFAIGFRARWLGKHTIFRKPFGRILRWMGGIPVNRSQAGNVVEQIVCLIKQSETMILGMSPEGTRKKVDRWKSGFYRIAEGAGIPIVPLAMDYGKKVIRIYPPFGVSGNPERDFVTLRGIFKDVTAKHPENF